MVILLHMEKSILFSLILPAYNEEKRLPECMEKVESFVASYPDPIEVILVENGSKDRTYELGQEYAAKYPWLTVLKEQTPGKGNAVRRGMLEAHGRYRMFADVDFSMPISEVRNFIPPILSDYDVAIGSREVKGAVRYNEPVTRHFTGRVFNLIVRILLGLPQIHDTQCGFKSFSAEAAQRLFSVQRINGWAFDAEVLFIAKQFGYKIVEVPVQWYYDGNSKINVIQDSLKMFRELLQIRKNYRKGLYK
ncbi:MAG: glycosyltransferase family 2 protein [Anaerolineaceae bacterium]|nr:glycosyltransferase family 2 protein [Anaerolineaceae bacterium]